MNATGSIQTTTQSSTVIGIQHVDNGGVVYKYDNATKELSIETSYYGYSKAVIVVPFSNPEELVQFFKHCANKDAT